LAENPTKRLLEIKKERKQVQRKEGQSGRKNHKKKKNHKVELKIYGKSKTKSALAICFHIFSHLYRML
jgi:hypothetical protein